MGATASGQPRLSAVKRLTRRGTRSRPFLSDPSSSPRRFWEAGAYALAEAARGLDECGERQRFPQGISCGNRLCCLEFRQAVIPAPVSKETDTNNTFQIFPVHTLVAGFDVAGYVLTLPAPPVSIPHALLNSAAYDLIAEAVRRKFVSDILAETSPLPRSKVTQWTEKGRLTIEDDFQCYSATAFIFIDAARHGANRLNQKNLTTEAQVSQLGADEL